MAQTYFPRVSLITSSGEHVRYVPGPLAAALVRGGTASAPSSGRVRSVTLTPQYLTRIGPPSTSTASGVRFHRWVRLDQSATRIVEHHPRCTYE